jgi:DNA-binding CsgD family transcriptional regulator
MADLLDVIESAYDGEGDDTRWMRRVLRASQPHLDRGRGLFGVTYDASNPEKFRIETIVSASLPLRGATALVKIAAEAIPGDLIRHSFLSRTCATMSELWGDGFLDENFLMKRIASLGVFDGLGINGGDPSGRGCAIGVSLRERAQASPETVATWERIGAHLAAGLRLRRAVRRIDGSDIDPIDDAEAVLDPDGRLRHAIGPAKTVESRAVLRHAAVALDRARGKLRRRDPQEAIDTWRALVDGRWTVFDHFDHDGRRFVVARRNDPDVRDEDALTLRERQIVGYAAMGHGNKLIAYELGLSPSTIATHLSSAAQKLGARSRVELIRRFARH